MRACVDLSHHRGLLAPVLGVILDDAQGVDPEIAYPEPAEEGDYILVCEWEPGQWNTSLVMSDVRGPGHDGASSRAPAMA